MEYKEESARKVARGSSGYDRRVAEVWALGKASGAARLPALHGSLVNQPKPGTKRKKKKIPPRKKN